MTKELELLTRLFTLGYLAGHENTVEGTFMDVHPSDWNTYFIDEDVVKEAAATLAKTQEGEVPSPSNWLTGILAKVPTMVLTDSMIRGIEAEAYRAMNNDKHRAKAEARLIAQQKAPEGEGNVLCRECGKPTMHMGTLCFHCSKSDSAAPGGDVERLREALENLISVAEPMAAEDGKCPPIREPNERGGTTVTIDPFPLLKYRVEDMDDLREGIKSARAIIAALSAPKQVGVSCAGELLDGLSDTFKGDDLQLLSSARSLLDLDKSGALVPHGIGGHARGIIEAFIVRMAYAPQAAPVPVEGEALEFFTYPAGLHPNTINLIARFATALADKLAKAEQKYGYSDGWSSSDWMDECRAHLMEHIRKGDPRDVAAYCAFLWHHGESTTAQAAQPSFDRDKIFRDAEFRAAAYSLMQLVEGPGCKRWEDGNGFRLKDTNEWCRFYVAVKNVQNFAAAPPSQPAVELEKLRPQLVAWIECNTEAAKRSPREADWSNGVAAGVRMALDLLDGAKAGKGEVK